jgi:hypothetical protein
MKFLNTSSALACFVHIVTSDLLNLTSSSTMMLVLGLGCPWYVAFPGVA